MRIDNIMQVQQMYKTNNTSKSKKNSSTSTSFADQIEISKTGKDIQVAKSALEQTDDIRAELVAPLKKSIEDGTYHVSDEDLADKLLANFGL